MLFWSLATALSLGVTLIFARALMRGGAGVPAAAYDLQIYRDQLAEVDRDLARGVLGEADADRARTEIARRILAADRELQAGDADRDGGGGDGGGDGGGPRGARYALMVGMVVVVAGGGLWLYARIGAPGYPDLSVKTRIEMAEEARAARISQAEAAARAAELRGPAPQVDPQFAELMEKLRAAVTARPDDLQGLGLLARNEAAVGDFAAAIAAQDQVIALRGDGEDYATLADLMVLAAAGYVTPEAEAAADRALALDPANGTARYYKGLTLAQTGRPDLAFGLWAALLEESPPDAPWVAAISTDIGDLAAMAGVDYVAPARPGETPRGPTAADIEAAGEMSGEDRQAMIRTMVDGLADRLASEGGPAGDWARLIGALGVLGETDRARAIWGEAQGVFAGRAGDLAAIRAAAEQAGVAE